MVATNLITLDAEKSGSLKSALSGITKLFGEGTIMRLGDMKGIGGVSVVPTGSLGLDIASGIGGVPRGRIIEIFGPESSGKTTLALHCIREAQKQKGVCAFIDAEHALDPQYAKLIGVDVDNLLVSQPDCGEQALEIVSLLIRSCAVEMVVVDSVAALTPRAELEGQMGDAVVGLQARLMSQALRKLTSIVSKTQSVVVFINQIRERISMNPYGPNETTTGGRALKFFSSMRLEVRKKSHIQGSDGLTGNRVQVKVVKNKLAPPFKCTEFDLLFGSGICLESELIEKGVECDVMKRSGSWFYYGERRLSQGKEGTLEMLRHDPKLSSEIYRKILDYFNDAKNGNESVAAAN